MAHCLVKYCNTAMQCNSSIPAPADSGLPQLLSSSSFRHDLAKTCAAFLLKSTCPLSTTTDPPLEFHPAPDLVPSHMSLYLPNHLIPKLSQKEHLWRQWDLSNRELMAWRGRMQWRTTKQILNMFSQLTLKDMEPETGHKADCHQEIKEQQSAQKWLFPGGWGQVVTSDIFIDTLATIEAKGVAKAVQKAQKEEKAALHVMWEASKQKWQRKRESLKSHGLKMELAGPKPQLKDMKLPGANTCNHWLWCLLLHQLQKHNLLLTEGHC